MRVTVDDATAAVESCAARIVELASTRLAPGQRVVGSDWTVDQVLAHLVSGARAYREVAEGLASPYASLDQRTAINQTRLEVELSSDLAALTDAVDREISAIVALIRSTRPTTVSWHGGIELTTVPYLGAIVGELMFHGLDLARTAKTRWPLQHTDAVVAVEFFDAVTPHIVDAAHAGSLTATIEVRYRGYDASTYRFEHGALEVSPGRAQHPDVHLSVDPAAFLAIGYGRRGLHSAMLRGQALAWGRKPWLGLRFPSLFQAP
ncbi:MAG: maleylpyruvate isomerase N-terminal domain-containing protein [Ilumatobacteraceae bacterium]